MSLQHPQQIGFDFASLPALIMALLAFALTFSLGFCTGVLVSRFCCHKQNDTISSAGTSSAILNVTGNPTAEGKGDRETTAIAKLGAIVEELHTHNEETQVMISALEAQCQKPRGRTDINWIDPQSDETQVEIDALKAQYQTLQELMDRGIADLETLAEERYAHDDEIQVAMNAIDAECQKILKSIDTVLYCYSTGTIPEPVHVCPREEKRRSKH
jgi:hypothetical protein